MENGGIPDLLLFTSCIFLRQVCAMSHIPGASSTPSREPPSLGRGNGWIARSRAFERFPGPSESS